MQDPQIEQLLSIESNKVALMKEIASYIDLEQIPYKIEFISCPHFILDSTLKLTPHSPETIYLIEGNKNSNELKMPSNGFSVTTILRGRKELISQYFRIIGQIGTIILYIQPYVVNNVLSIFDKAPNGGWHIRVASLKETDLRRIGVSI
jgi:hypothetical protein